MKIQALNRQERKDAIELLKSFGLPTEDLSYTNIVLYGIKYQEELIGCVGLEQYGELGILRSLAVSQQHQRKGVALKLITFLELTFKENGGTTLYLLTETAENYFSSQNYTTIYRIDAPDELKQSAEFTHLCADTAILMAKKI